MNGRVAPRHDAGVSWRTVSEQPPHAPITVVIIEDQKRAREGLASLVDGTAGFRVLGSYDSVEEALARMREPPDVVLSDIGLPGMSGIKGLSHIKERFPRAQVLILTVFADDDHVFEAICAGAAGYLLKDTRPARLIDSLREVRDGGSPMSPDIARRVVTMFQKFAPPKGSSAELSPREIDVLRRMAEGDSYKTAADALDISLDTVRFHIRAIYEKLHVHSKSEAVLKAFRTGLLT
jgi:DNA-binding NarL/FixJ family response regulator